MNRRLRSIIKYAFFLGLGIFLVRWQFHKMSKAEYKTFLSALQNAHYRLLLPVIIMALASHLSRAVRWKILIEPLGYKPALFNVFGSVMAGYLVNTFVTRVGEVVKCTLLGRYEKIPAEKLLGTILFERIFDLICYLIFIVLTILIQFSLVGDFVKTSCMELVHSNKASILLIKAAVFTSILLLFVFSIKKLYKKNRYNTLLIRIRNFIEGLKEGIASVKKMKQRKWFLFHTFFIWSMYVLQIYLGFFAIGEIAHLHLGAAFSVLSLATISMIVMPGGLGAFPKAVSWILLLYSIEEPIGEAFGFLMWGATTFIVVFFGLLFTGLMIYINKKTMSVHHNQTQQGMGEITKNKY